MLPTVEFDTGRCRLGNCEKVSWGTTWVGGLDSDSKDRWMTMFSHRNVRININRVSAHRFYRFSFRTQLCVSLAALSREVVSQLICEATRVQSCDGEVRMAWLARATSTSLSGGPQLCLPGPPLYSFLTHSALDQPAVHVCNNVLTTANSGSTHSLAN